MPLAEHADALAGAPAAVPDHVVCSHQAAPSCLVSSMVYGACSMCLLHMQHNVVFKKKSGEMSGQESHESDITVRHISRWDK